MYDDYPDNEIMYDTGCGYAIDADGDYGFCVGDVAYELETGKTHWVASWTDRDNCDDDDDYYDDEE